MVEEVTGHLRNVDQSKKAATFDRQGRLHLKEEEWQAWMCSHNITTEGGKKQSGKKDSNNDPLPVKCLNYGKKGHRARTAGASPRRVRPM
jgi:hypothetical protein